MTVIAAFVEGDKIWMGGDSAGIAGLDLTVRADQKVFRNGPMLFGFTSSFRMGQLLRYSFEVPDHPEGMDTTEYMSTVFINAVRKCLKDYGWASFEAGSEVGGKFLVGYRGQLFMIDSDYQVGIPSDGYDAVGCGGAFARGALFASPRLRGAKRIELALAAAERCSVGVRGPFHVECLAPAKKARKRAS